MGSQQVWTGAADCWVEAVGVEGEARGPGLGRRLVELRVQDGVSGRDLRWQGAEF